MIGHAALALALVLAGCHGHGLELTPKLQLAAGASVSVVLVRIHCGVDRSVNAAPRGWDTPIYVTENEGCPSDDGPGMEYLVDLKLRAAGFTVYPTTNDSRNVFLDDADRPPDPPSLRAGELNVGAAGSELIDGKEQRVFKLFSTDFTKVSAADRAHVHEQTGVDGVAQVDVVAGKHCFLCRDVSVVVTVTLYSLADYQPVWAASCEARSSESKLLEFLADDAARCAVERMPGKRS